MDKTGPETVRLPNIPLKPVYNGKFRDGSPQVKAAGRLTHADGEGVPTCLRPEPGPTSPEIIRRFRRTFRPDVSENRIFYGKANDPHLRWAAEARHGVSSHDSEAMVKLINPTPISLFEQKLADRKERDYQRTKRAPMGMLRNQRPGLPDGLDLRTHTFGKPLIMDEGAGFTANPNKTYTQVKEESEIGHRNYIISHNDYHPTEHVDRQYTRPFSPSFRYGGRTYADYTGKRARLCLTYPASDVDKEKATKIIPKRLYDYRQKFQPKVGEPLDPNKDTRRVGPDHAFGMPLQSNGYGVWELVHERLPRTYLQDKELQRGLIAAMRRTLKELNFHCFPEIFYVFRYYDKEGKGKIDKDDIREACLGFGLPLDPSLLEQVLDYCDDERDRLVDYRLFARFLDWKDKLPDGFAYVPYDVKTFLKQRKKTGTGDSTYSRPEVAKRFTPPVLDPGSVLIQKEIDRHKANYHTSAEMHNAAVGPSGLNTADFPARGVPTIRADLIPPHIRRLDDRKNYGDESTAYGLTNPSIYCTRGVYEKDLLIPRNKQELKEIFTNIGVELHDQIMDDVYGRVSAAHPQGHVSVESFRNALDDFQRAMILSGTHPLAF